VRLLVIFAPPESQTLSMTRVRSFPFERITSLDTSDGGWSGRSVAPPRVRPSARSRRGPASPLDTSSRPRRCMILSDLYADAVVNRVVALDPRDPSEWPPMSLILERCTDKVIAILAVFESGEFGDGWDDDIATLRDLAAQWTCLADALQIVERSYQSSGPN
jgi:hypothetical protein